MTRRKLTGADKRDLMEVAAYREMGKRNASLIVGWAVVKTVAPFVFVAAVVGLPVWFAWRTITSVGSESTGASSPVSPGPWPWLLLVLSGSTAVFLWVYRWANPRSGGPVLLVGIVFCFALSALAILWASATF